MQIGVQLMILLGQDKEVIRTCYGFHIFDKDNLVRKDQEYQHAITTKGIITIGPRVINGLEPVYLERVDMSSAIERGLNDLLELKGEDNDTYRDRKSRKDIWDRPLYSR